MIRKCIPVFVRFRVLLRRFLLSFGEDLRRGGRRR